MTEKLLQFIWQAQLFNRTALATTTGIPLCIIHPGTWNKDQGPDFLNAKIQIGTTLWAGNIELHLRTSDWIKHKHSLDTFYSNIILHVVFNDDLDDGIVDFPTLELNARVPLHFMNRYQNWMLQSQWIPCSMHLTSISDFTKIMWLQTIYAERLEGKMHQTDMLLQKFHNHWNRIIWILTARAYGMSKNADAFQQMAEQIDYTYLSRSHKDCISLEALFMGSLNMLPMDSSDEYSEELKHLYQDLLKKNRCSSVVFPVLFAKMRPENFPTIRLSQLAVLWSYNPLTIDLLLSISSLDALIEVLSVGTSNYWKNHYVFGRPTFLKEKRTGSILINTIIINVIVPVLFLYAKQTNFQALQERMIHWMESLSAESNTIIEHFSSYGIQCDSALESQALLQLKMHYCDVKRCLDCTFGRVILNKVVI